MTSAKILEEELCDKNEETLLQPAPNSSVGPTPCSFDISFSLNRTVLQ